MISVVLDTNVLFSRDKNFSKAMFEDQLIQLIDEIEANDLQDRVQLLIPQIVIDELCTRQCEDYEEAYIKVRDVQFHNCTIEYDETYSKVVEGLFLKILDDLQNRLAKIKIIPYPDNTVLPAIISRAVKKLPPFEGKAKASDKGFKDVLIWESVLEYKRKNSLDDLILFSGDGRISDGSLIKEFHSLFNDEIHVIKWDSNRRNSNDLFECIGKLTKLNVQPSFGHALEQRILNFFTDDNLQSLLEKHLPSVDNEPQYAALKISTKQISHIDEKSESICFTVKIIAFHFSWQKSVNRGNVVITPKSNEGAMECDILYDLKGRTFCLTRILDFDGFNYSFEEGKILLN
jgi:hypothetical protein